MSYKLPKTWLTRSPLPVFTKLLLMVVCLMVAPVLPAHAQTDILKTAEDKMDKKNFKAAFKIYGRIADRDTNNAEANFGAGICVLSMSMSKKMAVTYLERAIRAGSKEVDAMFFLGMAYHINLQYDFAIAALTEYKAAEEGSYLGDVDRQIEMVRNAKKIARAPINVEFHNVGKLVNSQFPDYYPMITPDESFIAFTSRRRKNVQAKLEFDGFYSSDIWMSRVAKGQFKPAENCGRKVNTALDEQLVGLSHDGNRLFIYTDHIKEYGNIYYSDYTVDDGFGSKNFLDETVNSEFFESAASISADGATYFFSSERPDGLGGKDIYMTRKLPNGQWAIPQNLGPKINTPYNEDFPYLFFDGKSLYFASEGHNSIGGYDLFRTKWNPEKNSWSKPVNLGYPVNTPEDEFTISYTADQRHAYVSRWLPDSHGEQDIYRITFLDKDPRRTIFKSKITRANSQQIIKDAIVIVLDNLSEEEVGNYVPDPKTGSIIMALQPGSYNVIIEADGYASYSENLIVMGKSDFKDFQLKEFIITPQ